MAFKSYLKLNLYAGSYYEPENRNPTLEAVQKRTSAPAWRRSLMTSEVVAGHAGGTTASRFWVLEFRVLDFGGYGFGI